MSDSISKRFIQEVLIERISNLNAEGEKSIQTARELIRFKRFVDGLTPTDAVEVVRCRDCIHWFPHTQCGFDEDNDEYHDYCGLLIPDDDYYAFRRKSDDYCSYGERREDGEV